MSVSQITLNGETVNLVAMPAAPGLRVVEFTCFDGVGLIKQPFVGASQTQRWHGGDMWSGKATLPSMLQPNADVWIAFLEELRGVANAFQMGDPLQTAPRGTVSGSPFVDGTLNNGNPAGSIFLGTKGWTPNAIGVLLPGDYIQVGWRLYRVLDQVDADSGGQAVFPIWPCLREQALDVGLITSPTTGTGNAFGTATKFRSVTLGGYTAAVLWNFFVPPPLPADAVIQGIFPVIIASSVQDICIQTLGYGPGTSFGGADSEFTQPYNTDPITPEASFASTEFYAPGTGTLTGKGIGTDLGLLVDQGILMSIASSLLEDPINDSITATGVGYAVYYTSATPVIDPLMPAPFTIPAGQGVAWALPFNAELGFNPVTGTASGYPSSRIATAAPKGLWRLATNKRNWLADVQKISTITFPFQEYR